MTKIDKHALKRAKIFSRLSPEELDVIAQTARPVSIRKGETLFHQADEADCFYLVVDGWIALYRDAESGVRTTLHVFGAGESFAEAAMFLGGRFPASAEAAQDSLLYSFDRELTGATLSRMPSLALGMLAALSQHLHRFMMQLERVTFLSTEQRIAQFLQQRCDADSGPCEVSLPYNKSLIAERLGMKPESFSRTLSKLKSRGITAKAHSIMIEDSAVLSDILRGAD